MKSVARTNLPTPGIIFSRHNQKMSVKIDRIELRNALPRVFEHEAIPASDVWKCDVAFERGKHYIIEAASGTGKSSLCAYIYGNRPHHKFK